jgi:hypothetical protein
MPPWPELARRVALWPNNTSRVRTKRHCGVSGSRPCVTVAMLRRRHSGCVSTACIGSWPARMFGVWSNAYGRDSSSLASARREPYCDCNTSSVGNVNGMVATASSPSTKKVNHCCPTTHLYRSNKRFTLILIASHCKTNRNKHASCYAVRRCKRLARLVIWPIVSLKPIKSKHCAFTNKTRCSWPIDNARLRAVRARARA